MNRRNFLGTLFGLAVAPAVAAKVLPSPPKPKYKVYKDDDGDVLVGYKGREFFEEGYVRAPYIPMQIVTIPLNGKTRKMDPNWTCEIDSTILLSKFQNNQKMQRRLKKQSNEN